MIAVPVTETRSVPRPIASNWAFMVSVAPCTTVIRAMIAPTPMMMPSVVKNVRILLPAMLESDMETLSANISHFFLIIGAHPLGEHAVQNVDDAARVARSIRRRANR